MRKALQTEQGKGDMEDRIGTLEAETKDFERQVQSPAVSCFVPSMQRPTDSLCCFVSCISDTMRYH